MRALYARLERLPPPLVLGASMLLGLLLLAASVAARLHDLDWPTTGGVTKKVGYFYEINWSVNYLVVIPVSLYFMVLTLNSIQEAIFQITEARMVYDTDGRPLSYQAVLADWHHYAGKGMWIVLGLFILSLIASYTEWCFNCLFPILNREPIAHDMGGPGLLAGWSVGDLIESDGVNAAANVAFGLFAFSAQSLAAGCLMGFVALNVTFACWVFGFTIAGTASELYPALDSDDSRCGFERFGLYVENLLFATLAFFAVLFLIRLNHLYLSTDAASVQQFIANDVGAGFFAEMRNLIAFRETDLFDVGPTWTYSTFMAVFAAVILVPMAFLVPSVILRQSAIRSRDRLRILIQDSPAGATAPGHRALRDLAPENSKQRLNKMIVWPLLYPKPVQLLVLAVVTLGAFLFYRLTLLLVGVIVAIGMKEVVKVFSSGSGGAAQAGGR